MTYSKNDFQFRKATISDIARIWEILQQAIERRRQDGSSQWQDGYPNQDVIAADINKNAGFVLTLQDNIAGYTAALINDEPSYAHIQGKWLSDGDFVVVHRVAVANEFLGKGIGKIIFAKAEEYAVNHEIFSLKVDTNFDNLAILTILDQMGYSYCGEVLIRNNSRKAYEKILKK